MRIIKTISNTLNTSSFLATGGVTTENTTLSTIEFKFNKVFYRISIEERPNDSIHIACSRIINDRVFTTYTDTIYPQVLVLNNIEFIDIPLNIFATLHLFTAEKDICYLTILIKEKN